MWGYGNVTGVIIMKKEHKIEKYVHPAHIRVGVHKGP